MKSTVLYILLVALAVLCVLQFLIAKENAKKRTEIKPIELFLVQVVNDPNWIINYGDDLESRLVYNVALLNEVVNRQGNILKRLLEDPNR
ncbi:hypothetical protein LCGC14_1894610 [marine sediment metagenome]|uniref:Uncharacterized protein n=1 Tax=marine sediment metagenome TaxID=412755 RepID=A0A0F9IC97_9ZZZZ